MIVVVDTNIIFSAILNPNGVIGLKFIYPLETLILIAPEYLKKEIWKHKSRIKKIGNYTEEDFEFLMSILLSKINFYSEEIFAEFILNHAHAIMKDGDQKDIPFVAMALFFKVNIWTGDKKLKFHLYNKGLDICVNISEI
jgi:predicted nucleic acid-binding protein